MDTPKGKQMPGGTLLQSPCSWYTIAIYTATKWSKNKNRPMLHAWDECCGGLGLYYLLAQWWWWCNLVDWLDSYLVRSWRCIHGRQPVARETIAPPQPFFTIMFTIICIYLFVGQHLDKFFLVPRRLGLRAFVRACMLVSDNMYGPLPY